MKAKELCSILHCSRQCLYDWRKRGMPYDKEYDIHKVLEWLENNLDSISVIDKEGLELIKRRL